MKSLRGYFLVASPHLSDPNFDRTVVLLVQHDEEGALGLVLNRPTGKTVRDALKLVTEEEVSCDDEIHLGGPVRGPISMLHTDELRGNCEVLAGVYYTVEDELVNELLQVSGTPRRVFVGYSGWGPGQLESELQAGGWLTAAANVDDCFVSVENQWQVVSRRIEREFLSRTIKPRVVPENPSLN